MMIEGNDPKVVFRKKLSWHEAADLGLTPDQIQHTWGWYWDTCRKYKQIVVHFHADHAIVSLTERRSGQMLQPVFVPYSKIWVARTNTKQSPDKSKSHVLMIQHPVAGYILTVIREKDFLVGNVKDLVLTIADGREAEEAANVERGFAYNDYIF